MEEEAVEVRLNGETQQKMVLSLQDEQSKLTRQLTQLQLALQEKDSHIQYVHLHVYSLLQTKYVNHAYFASLMIFLCP